MSAIDFYNATILCAVAVTTATKWPKWIELTENDQQHIIYNVIDGKPIDVSSFEWFQNILIDMPDKRILQTIATRQINDEIAHLMKEI